MEKFGFSSTLVGKQIALINFFGFLVTDILFSASIWSYCLQAKLHVRTTWSLLALFEEWWLTKYRLQRKQVVSIQRIYLLLPFLLHQPLVINRRRSACFRNVRR